LTLKKKHSCERTYRGQEKPKQIPVSLMAGVVADTSLVHTKDHNESKLTIDGNPFLLLFSFYFIY
jgi:hypothetical protein